VARSSGGDPISTIDQQLKDIIAFAFDEGVADYLMTALKSAASRVEQRSTLAARAEMQSKRDAEKVKQPQDLKSLRRPQAKSAEKTESPLQVDEQLDLLAFSTLIRQREGLDIDDDLIKKVFAVFDTDGSGTVSAHEYLLYSLCEALGATELRAVDLFKQWDEDASGEIDEKEFCKAVQVLGYAVPPKVASRLFKELDVDKSGKLQYNELGAALTKRIGQESSKAELLRYTPGGQQANRDNRLGKVVARDSTNYASVRVRTLPSAAQLDASSNVPVMEQLGRHLTENSATIIRLFQDWDEDGNGGISKAEFRRAIKGMGYAAPTADIDALFVSLQGENRGKSDMDEYLEIEELHKALHSHVRGSKHARAPPPLPPPVEMPLQADAKLDLLAFAQLARSREGDELDDEHIKLMFAAFDEDGSGTVSAHEYLEYSLREACVQTGKRMVELFKSWDEDKGGTVSEKEFKRAVKMLGFAVPDKVASSMYKKLDADGNGLLKYNELVDLLSKKQPGKEASKAEIMRYTPGGQAANRDSRLGKPSARDSYSYETVRVRALPAEAQLDPESDISIVEQLGLLLTLHAKTIVSLLRDWDEDGNGGVDKKEFRRAIAALGYKAPNATLDVLFNELDIVKKDGFLEYDEMQKALRKFIRPKNAPGGPGGGGGLMESFGRGDGRSKLGRLQETKSGTRSQDSLGSGRPGSRGATPGGQSQGGKSEFSYSSLRPSTAEWVPKRYDYVLDFKARWPYA